MVSAALAWECTSDLGCQLNGKCVEGVCHCSDAWTGTNCSTLALLPTPKEAGLNLPNDSTWGGNVLKGKDGKYHLYAAYMEKGCGLTGWVHDSKIVHAVSDTKTGQYQLADTAIPAWSHNPAPIMAPDGTFVLYHIGQGIGTQYGVCNADGDCCRNGTSPCGFGHCTAPCNCADEPHNADFNLTLTVHYADTPEGPWKVWPVELPKGHAGNNPAPWVHPNGTMYLLSVSNDMSLMRADTWKGPYTSVTTGACGGGEDPYLFTDENGNWHCLYHRAPFNNLTVAGGHSFSENGYDWHISEAPAYSGDYVTYTETGRHEVAKRERPRFLFDDAGAPIALLNGVVSRKPGANETYGNFLAATNPFPGHYDRSHTHLQFVNHSSHYE